MVTAEWLRRPRRPTLLVYGHFDVQPAEPESAWQTPPFSPTVSGDTLVARGAADDKGPLFAHVKAAECWLRTARRLPVNVRCLFEGEEEVGSPTLNRFLQDHPEAAAADVAVMSDTRMLGPGRPALTYGLRGGLALELAVHGPRHDLHSGHFGGAIHNPAQALCEIIASLHGSDGRVAVTGFYDRVRSGRSSAVGAPGDAEVLRAAGAPAPWGEAAFSLHERTTVRPALTVNGLTSGYQGPGSKAIIPAVASAKINIRLVPDQDPLEIERLLRAHVGRAAPSSVNVTLTRLSVARPVLTDPSHPAMRAAAVACRRAFGRPPALLRSGGTIPIVDRLTRRGIPTVLLGLTLPDAQIHAPNERFHLPTFYQGVEAAIWFLAALGAAPVRAPIRKATGAMDP